MADHPAAPPADRRARPFALMHEQDAAPENHPMTSGPFRRTPRPVSPARSRRRLSLEFLEDRTLLTVTINQVGGNLLITGDANPDQVTLSLATGDPSHLVVDDGTGNPQSFATAGISSISVSLAGGADSLALDTGNGDPVVAPLTYDGGAA